MNTTCFRIFVCFAIVAQSACSGSESRDPTPQASLDHWGTDTQSWILRGDDPTEFDSTVDGSILRLTSKVNAPTGFGTAMEQKSPGAHAGKRVVMKAEMRGQDIKGWAGMWLRVDGIGRTPLAFDNMQDRALHGTSDWAVYSITLDVSPVAVRLAYGVLLSGAGEVDVRNVTFEAY